MDATGKVLALVPPGERLLKGVLIDRVVRALKLTSGGDAIAVIQKLHREGCLAFDGMSEPDVTWDRALYVRARSVSVNGPEADELCSTCGHMRSRHIDRAGVDSDEPCDEEGCGCLEWRTSPPPS